jgi:predicted RNA binding protein YcfA (HicA-like mRNA interferase family)
MVTFETWLARARSKQNPYTSYTIFVNCFFRAFAVLYGGAMGNVYTPQELITFIKRDGWKLDNITGSHHIFVHPIKKGNVVVPKHTGTVAKGTANNILKQAGLK